MPTIEIRSLQFSYPGRPLFSDLNISWQKPCVVVLLGPSGSGKSTLLKLIAGVLPPTGGSVLVNGAKPRHTAWVPQDGGLFPWLTVEKNIRFPSRLQVGSSIQDRLNGPPALQNICYSLGLEGIRRRYPKDISGGQAQRVAIGRALAAKSEILLMDEPFSALDPSTRVDVRRVVTRATRENNMISVIATHDLLDAAFIGDIAIILSGTSPATLAELPLESDNSPEGRRAESAAQIAISLGKALTGGQGIR